MRNLAFLVLAFVVLAGAAAQASASCRDGVQVEPGTIFLTQTWPYYGPEYPVEVISPLMIEVDNMVWNWMPGQHMYQSPNGFKYKFCADGTYEFYGPDGTLLASGTWRR